MPRLTDYGRVLNSGGKTFLFLSLTLFVCLFVNFQLLRSQSHRLGSSEVSGNNSLFCTTKVTTTAAQSHFDADSMKLCDWYWELKKNSLSPSTFSDRVIPPGSANAVKSRQAHTASAPSFLHRTCFMSPFFCCRSPGGAYVSGARDGGKKKMFIESQSKPQWVILTQFLIRQNVNLWKWGTDISFVSYLCLPGMCENISFSTKLKTIIFVGGCKQSSVWFYVQ